MGSLLQRQTPNLALAGTTQDTRLEEGLCQGDTSAIAGSTPGFASNGHQHGEQG